MPDVVSKSPEANYASRSEGVVSNIKYPAEAGGAQTAAAAAERARTELNDQQLDAVVTAIDATTLRADVDAAMVAQGATACINAGARAAIAAVLTNALVLSRTTQTVQSSPTIDT
jgi:hypothetical protein